MMAKTFHVFLLNYENVANQLEEASFRKKLSVAQSGFGPNRRSNGNLLLIQLTIHKFYDILIQLF
jgi:hypothetical protein